MSYAIYNINASTSVVQVPTSNLSTTSFTPVVLLNSVNAPGQLVTIRDFEGAASLQFPITVSTVNGVNFLQGPQVSSYTITQPFGFMTVSPRTPSIWNVMNTFAFPDSNAAANINTLNANVMVVSSVYASGEVNMSSLSVSTLTVLQFLDIASTNIENAIVQSNVYIGGVLSTGSFFAGDASTLTMNVIDQVQIGPNATSSPQLVIYTDSDERLTITASNGNARIQHLNSGGSYDTPYIGFGGGTGNMNIRDPSDQIMINFSSFAQGVDVNCSLNVYSTLNIGPNTTSSPQLVIYTDTDERLTITASDGNARIQHLNSGGSYDTPYIGFGGGTGNMNIRDPADNIMMNFSSLAQGIDVKCSLNMSNNSIVLDQFNRSVLYYDANDNNTYLKARSTHSLYLGTNSNPFQLQVTNSSISINVSTVFIDTVNIEKTLTVGTANFIKIYSSTPQEGGAMQWNEVFVPSGQAFFELYSSKGSAGGGVGGFAFYTGIPSGTPASMSNLAMRIYSPGLDTTTLVVDGGGTFTSTVIANNFTALGSNNATNFLYGNTYFGDLGEVRLSNGFSSIGGTATFTNTVNFSNATVQGLSLSNISLSNTTFTGTANFSNATVQGLSFSLPVVNL